MDSFLPYLTGDSSVGLFSDQYDDVYHSAYGALTEAYEKFVNPIDLKNNVKSNINVLDICYGLGYNTKSLLNYIINNNLFADKLTDSKKINNINIDCIDINSQLIKLSPFIKTNQNLPDKIIAKFFPNCAFNNLSKIDYKKIEKFIQETSTQNPEYKINDLVNEVIILNLFRKYDNDLNSISKYLSYKKLNRFLAPQMINFVKFYQNCRLKHTQSSLKGPNLHNIYYLYLSNRYKYDYLSLLDSMISINFHDIDARVSLSQINDTYDYIFLDAFTTDKCPSLWSLEFIQLIYERMNDEGVLLTYTTSALVRNTMVSVGFSVGKILDSNNKPIGTICSKNSSKIQYKLNDFESGLLNTKAGIPYRDFSLNSSDSAIIKKRLSDVDDSDLILSSHYVKQFKGVKNEI